MRNRKEVKMRTFFDEGIHDLGNRGFWISRSFQDSITEEVVHLQEVGVFHSVRVTHTRDLDTLKIK